MTAVRSRRRSSIQTPPPIGFGVPCPSLHGNHTKRIFALCVESRCRMSTFLRHPCRLPAGVSSCSAAPAAGAAALLSPWRGRVGPTSRPRRGRPPAARDRPRDLFFNPSQWWPNHRGIVYVFVYEFLEFRLSGLPAPGASARRLAPCVGWPAARTAPMLARVAPRSARVAPMSARVAPMPARVAPMSARVAPMSAQVAPMSARTAPA